MCRGRQWGRLFGASQVDDEVPVLLSPNPLLPRLLLMLLLCLPSLDPLGLADLEQHRTRVLAQLSRPFLLLLSQLLFVGIRAETHFNVVRLAVPPHRCRPIRVVGTGTGAFEADLPHPVRPESLLFGNALLEPVFHRLVQPHTGLWRLGEFKFEASKLPLLFRLLGPLPPALLAFVCLRTLALPVLFHALPVLLTYDFPLPRQPPHPPFHHLPLPLLALLVILNHQQLRRAWVLRVAGVILEGGPPWGRVNCGAGTVTRGLAPGDGTGGLARGGDGGELLGVPPCTWSRPLVGGQAQQSGPASGRPKRCRH
eukprot:Hpha_TRINITY_DN14941_c2_g12::TRINITY_DN14941_c2_g12_i1::g.143529::m.143529